MPTIWVLTYVVSHLIKFNLSYLRKSLFARKKKESKYKSDDDLVHCHKRARKSHNTRAFYKAQIIFKFNVDLQHWKVHNFVKQHSHPLVTPTKRRFLRVNREITHACRGFIESLNSSHIPPYVSTILLCGYKLKRFL
ncbi:hypothetical protein ZOSMA_32G00390 [Zostera marina]|uniref:FAR1 domain-containing protein n=1 Tax=Zostera marina TaxID=29655 RepID=A0A0K9PAP9_ZOSMR|nr:hypothetical protein ZOSMA_32G00390 [Zostera marina]